MTALGRKLKIARSNKNMTALDLAESLGVARATITRYETGMSNVVDI